MKHTCFEVTTPAGNTARIHGNPNMDPRTLEALTTMTDLAYEQFSNGTDEWDEPIRCGDEDEDEWIGRGDDREDDEDEWLYRCGWVSGQGCTMAGSEECDFECPLRADFERGLALTQARLAKRAPQKKERS